MAKHIEGLENAKTRLKPSLGALVAAGDLLDDDWQKRVIDHAEQLQHSFPPVDGVGRLAMNYAILFGLADIVRTSQV